MPASQRVQLVPALGVQAQAPRKGKAVGRRETQIDIATQRQTPLGDGVIERHARRLLPGEDQAELCTSGAGERGQHRRHAGRSKLVYVVKHEQERGRKVGHQRCQQPPCEGDFLAAIAVREVRQLVDRQSEPDMAQPLAEEKRWVVVALVQPVPNEVAGVVTGDVSDQGGLACTRRSAKPARR